jgi:hypothetical protein
VWEKYRYRHGEKIDDAVLIEELRKEVAYRRGKTGLLGFAG